jgi:phage gp46-like protein
MAWDLAISEHGDLVFGGNRDLAGVSGIDLIEQRIKTRLKVPRGTWLYDRVGDLGSSLHTVSNMRPEHVITAAKGYTAEALRPLDEIQVQEIQVDADGRGIAVTVFYLVNDDAGDEPEIHELSTALPFSETDLNSLIDQQ